MENNPFLAKRLELGYSQNFLIDKLGSGKYSVRKLESESWKELPIDFILEACKILKLNIPHFLSLHFGVVWGEEENGSDEFEYLVTTNAISRMQMFLYHIDEFCRLAKVRKYDYDWIRIGCSLKDINNLSILVHKLSEGNITRKEALEILPPDYKKSKRYSNVIK